MKALIIGGAGFIGCNIAKRLIDQEDEVLVFDNLSRKGTHSNLRWLQSAGPVRFIEGDIRQSGALQEVFHAHPDIDVVYHMAAQVAVTTSVTNPREDFEINAFGTFNVLEAIRLAEADPILIFASTNKVYGGMEEVKIVEKDGRYAYRDFAEGIPEDRLLDFHSPYGCSKGAGDQYVRDYSRIYGLPTVVFRQSAIYGPRQMGVEDQGWMAWFVIAAVTGKPITIYGNGKQVRDMLFVDDLLNAYDAAIARIDVAAGQVYNVGGGPTRTISVWTEFGPLLEQLLGRPIPVAYGDWRPGDQPVYVSDIAKAGRELDWQPQVDVEEGVRRLYEWVVANRDLF